MRRLLWVVTKVDSRATFVLVVTKLDTPKPDYRERTGTEWLVLGLGTGLGEVVSVNPNPNLTLKLTIIIIITTIF